VAGDLAKALNVPQDAGLLVQRVAYDSPGHKLGLKPGSIPIRIGDEKLFIGGDIVLEVQGRPVSVDIEETCKIRDRMGGLTHGERLNFKVLRGGKIIDLYTPK
jgi:serine protease Do